MYEVVLFIVHVYAVISVGFTTAHLFFFLRRQLAGRSAKHSEKCSEKALESTSE